MGKSVDPLPYRDGASDAEDIRRLRGSTWDSIGETVKKTFIGVCLTGFLVGVMVIGYSLRRNSTFTASAGRAERRLIQFLAERGASELMSTSTNIRYGYYHPLTRQSPSEWLVFDLPSAEVQKFCQLMTGSWQSQASSMLLDDSDANHTDYLNGEDTEPPWWRPDELTDVDLLRVLFPPKESLVHAYAVDRKSGRVYVWIPGW